MRAVALARWVAERESLHHWLVRSGRSVILAASIVAVAGALSGCSDDNGDVAGPHVTPVAADCDSVRAMTSLGARGTPGPCVATPHGSEVKPQPNSDEGRVVHAIDGCTVVLSDGRSIHYIGVDAPDMKGKLTQSEPFAEEATEANRRLVEGKIVWMEKDKTELDEYGHFLRYVYVGGIMVNAELLREGYARLEEPSPDSKYYECLRQLEEEARAAGRGVWGQPSP